MHAADEHDRTVVGVEVWHLGDAADALAGEPIGRERQKGELDPSGELVVARREIPLERWAEAISASSSCRLVAESLSAYCWPTERLSKGGTENVLARVICVVTVGEGGRETRPFTTRSRWSRCPRRGEPR